MTTAIYVRISDDKTGQEAGVQRQEAECRALAERHGWEITEVYRDNDLSATSGVRRPAFEAMLAAPPERIVIWHLDRLVRLPSDLERIIDLEINVHAVQAGHLDLSNPSGRAVARTVTAWSRYEGEIKSARQRASNRQRAQQGRTTWSRRPYGYDRAGDEVTVVPHEAQVLQEAARDVLAGASLASVARSLNERGVPTSLGNPWSVTSLKRALTNPRVGGLLVYDGEVYGEHPAILDPETYERLLQRLTDPGRRTAPASTRAKYLLSGLAVCGRCGGRMYVTNNISGRGRRTQVLRCKGCATTRLYQPTEALVRDVVLHRLSLPDVADLLVGEEETQAQRDEVAAEVISLRERRDELTRLLEDGLMGIKAVREATERIARRLEPLERRLEALTGDSPLVGIADAEDPVQAFLEAPLEHQRGMVATLLRVVVLPVGKGSRWTREGIRIEPTQE